ncbi:MAG: O-antigen ligase family protein [Bacteroidia bacterium]
MEIRSFLAMLAKKFWSNHTVNAFLILSFIGFTALWYSEFIISVVTAVAVVISIISYRKGNSRAYNGLFLSLLFILALAILDAVFHIGGKVSGAKLLLAVGMVGVGIASFKVFEDAKRKNLITLFIGMLACVSVINIIAVSGYLTNKEYLDQMLLQSKSIPIPNMHHIHFGIINALVIIGSVGTLVLGVLSRIQRNLTIVLLTICLISFHILSSRTGLVSFYSGTVVTLIVYSIQQKKYKVLFTGVLSMIFLVAGSYTLSSSFQNKISNSIEDINSWGKGDEVNHKSMGMRIEAYKMCLQVLLENPIGVGSDAQSKVQQEMYISQNTVLTKENRVGPHNQFLEFGVKYGWLGVLGILVFLLSLMKLLPQSSAFYFGIVTIILVSLQFESLFERQKSIYFCMTLIPLFYFLLEKRQLNAKI